MYKIIGYRSCVLNRVKFTKICKYKIKLRKELGSFFIMSKVNVDLIEVFTV